MANLRQILEQSRQSQSDLRNLHQYILLLHAKTARAEDKARIAELEAQLRERKMKGLRARAESARQALTVLTDDVGRHFDRLTSHIQTQQARVPAIFNDAQHKISESVDQMRDELAGITTLLDDPLGDNGGPLDGSGQPSGGSGA